MEEKSSLDTVYTPEVAQKGKGLAKATQSLRSRGQVSCSPATRSPALKASLSWLLREGTRGSGNRDQGGWLGSGILGVELEKTPKGLCMSSFLPSFSTQQLDKLSEKPSQGTPGAGLQGCSAESDLPAPASEKRPKIEGRTLASPYYCEWILSGGWLGKQFGDSCRDLFS